MDIAVSGLVNLSHSTGHPDRLNREQGGKFVSEQYAYAGKTYGEYV